MEINTYRGCLAVVGPQIDQQAKKWISEYQSDETFLQSLEQQTTRDGDHYHLTVVASQEITPEIKTKLSTIDLSSLPFQVYDLAIGKLKKDKEVCYYLICQAPELTILRKQLGLIPTDFHITLGFLGHDLHNGAKDLTTACYRGDSIRYYQQLEKLLAHPKNELTLTTINELKDNSYLAGLFYYSKYQCKQVGLKLTYEELAESITTETWKVLDNQEPYGDKLLKVLNHAIKARYDKFARFYSYEITDKGEYKFSYEELPRNFSYITERLAGSSILKKRAYFQILAELGFTTVITVMEKPLYPELYQNLNIDYHWFEVEDQTPPTKDQMLEMMQVVDQSTGPTIVHCMGGVGRTATVLAAYLMWSQGISKVEAKKPLEARKTILSPRQEEFLRDWYGVCQTSKSILKVKLPPVIMMVGYPSSGKSTFSKALVAAGGDLIHRINQDETGRKECETSAGVYVKKRGHVTILDRCHLTPAERKEWLGLTLKSKTWCLYFDVPIEECKWRIVRRQNHPSIKQGGGLRILKSLEGQLVEPTLEEGFEKIITLRTFDEVNSLLAEWGCPIPEDELANLEDRLVKFPRTRHVANLGSATRDDLIMDKNEVAEFLNREIYVEEKIDGANLGISIKDNEICVQNRSHYVNSAYHPQFKYLDKWIYQHTAELWDLLTPNTHILFGEWVYARHSIKYTGLPDYFVAFDLYDRIKNKFWSRERLEQHLKGTSIALIPVIANGSFKTVDELKALVQTSSQFYTGPVEGAYLRICEADWLVKRGKIVRSDFLSGNTHWSKNILDPNIIKSN